MLSLLQWVAMAALAAAATIAVLVPLFRARPNEAGNGPALAIYRDQLVELAADRERGMIAAGEAEAARVEIARRILKAGADVGTAGKPVSDMARRMGTLLMLAIPALALGVYLSIGQPNLPDAPLAARANNPADLAALVAEVERRLAANPEDARGWEVLAPAYRRLGRHDAEVNAVRNMIRLLGPTPELEATLGEAITAANGGMVTDGAEAAFERAQAGDPAAVRPRYYLALALSQEKSPAAAAAWRALLADAPAEGASWVTAARAELARVESGAPGPDADAVRAAAAMKPEERQAMVEGMVASLAARLAAEPGDPAGWVRLMRSYMVLGRPDDARAALVGSRKALAGRAADIAMVETEARALGLVE